MSTKKRFEQLESQDGDKPKKPTLLEKVSFKRKLEIEGVAREAIPQEKTTQKESAPKQDIKKVHSHQQPVATHAPNSIAREVELAEQKKRAQPVKQNAQVQIQNKVLHEFHKQKQIDDAHQRAEAAKSKILIAVIAIPILGYLVYKLSGTVGRESMGGRGSSIIMLIISVVLGGLGTRRNRW